MTRNHSHRRRGTLLALAALAVFGFVLAPARTGDADDAPLPGAPRDTADISAGVERADSSSTEIVPAPAEPIRAGESLRFSVQYGPIKAGTAWLEIPQVVDWNGHRAFSLVARAESNGFFSAFYKVRNRIESVWDVDGRFSWHYRENRREGGYRVSNEITFDRDSLQARWPDGQTYPIPRDVQDALSSFYYTRCLALPLGRSVWFDYHASRKSVPLEVKVLGRQKIKTPAGTFQCIAIEPYLKAGGVFKNKGRLVIWLTEDDRRMPVLMRSYLTIGSISVVLQEVKNGG